MTIISTIINVGVDSTYPRCIPSAKQQECHRVKHLNCFFVKALEKNQTSFNS